MFDPPVVKRECIINTKSGVVFRGVVWRVSRGWVTVKNAAALGNATESKMDGDLVLKENDILFYQVIA